VLISGNQVQTDESNLTGEPEYILKTPIDALDAPVLKTDCFLFGGSTVMQGTGVGVVCAVGVNSMQGKL
jgi:magnesium-transporting ATPase (P-type)